MMQSLHNDLFLPRYSTLRATAQQVTPAMSVQSTANITGQFFWGHASDLRHTVFLFVVASQLSKRLARKLGQQDAITFFNGHPVTRELVIWRETCWRNRIDRMSLESTKTWYAIFECEPGCADFVILPESVIFCSQR